MQNSILKFKVTKGRYLFILTMVFVLLFSNNAFAAETAAVTSDMEFWNGDYTIYTSSTVHLVYEYDDYARVADLYDDCYLDLTLGCQSWMHFNDIIDGYNRPFDFPEYNGSTVTWDLKFYYNDQYNLYNSSIRVCGYVDEWGSTGAYTDLLSR